MNIENEILLQAKLIKVKKKVEKIFEKFDVVNITKQYATKYLRAEKLNKDAEDIDDIFLQINLHPKILKSPFIFLNIMSNANLHAIQGIKDFLKAAEPILSKKSIDTAFKNQVNLSYGTGFDPTAIAKYIPIKKVVLYFNFGVTLKAKKTFLKRADSFLRNMISHEWVHVEQVIRSKGIRDKEFDSTVPVGLTEGRDSKTLGKFHSNIIRYEDKDFIETLSKYYTNVLGTLMRNGDNVKGDESFEKSIESALSHNLGKFTYFSMRSEIMAYAVTLADIYVNKTIWNKDRVLFNSTMNIYLTMGVVSSKIKRKFLRFYSEALQERGVDNQKISKHINKVTSKFKKRFTRFMKIRNKIKKSIGFDIVNPTG
jgi:hypothetical protein